MMQLKKEIEGNKNVMKLCMHGGQALCEVIERGELTANDPITAAIWLQALLGVAKTGGLIKLVD